MTPRFPTGIIALAAVALLGAPRLAHAKSPGGGSQDPSTLARELARLRAEVEDLSSKIEREKEDRRLRLRALSTQRTDVEMELNREKLRIKQLTDSLERERGRIAQANAARSALAPAVLDAIATVRGSVAGGLPYRKSERLAALDDLKTRVEQNLIDPGQAFARLWETVEDELRLGRESALDRQVVPLEGGERLVDVIKVGMVMLYFRADEETYGRAVRDGDGWKWVTFEGEQLVKQMRALYETFDKRLRTGFFTIPSALEASR